MEANWITMILNQIGMFVNIPYLLTFVLLTYFVKKNFSQWLQKITKFNWLTVYTVLIIATVTGLLFWIFIKDLQLEQILLSYAVGTSLHELIFQHLENLIKPNKKDTP